MALSNLHPLDPTTAYLTERGNLLKQWENDPLFRHSQNNTVTPQDLSVTPDNRGFLAIGYGLDLLHNSPQAIADYFIAANIQLPGHTGIGLSAADLQLIINYQADPLNNAQALRNGFPPLPSEADATALLNVRAGVAENQLDQILGFHMQESRERAVLASLAYNNASALLGPKLVAAIQTDNRAEAWHEIRYNSNSGASQSSGIANRRIAESDLFNLYDNPGQGVGEAEAKEVLRMYTTHRTEIQAYESQFSTQFAPSGTATIQFQLTSAITTLIANFAEGRTINGEVLVGQNDVFPGDILEATASGDLLFGERGNDVLRGAAGTDVLYGGEGIDTLSGGADNDLLRGEAGDDTLQGGTGNDLLEGGAGFDTYFYTTGDGNDTIEDSDATGKIVFNGGLLQGGISTDGGATYVSLDGTETYVLSGGHLIVNGVLTVNADFQSGQFGIELNDLSSYPTNTGVPTGPFQHVYIGTETSDYMGNGVNGLNNGAYYGLGGNDQIIADTRGNTLQDGGAGDDFLHGRSGGDEYLDGGAGNDLVLAFVSFDLEHTTFYGGIYDGHDILLGGIGDDVLVVIGALPEGVAPDPDYLDGGEGADYLRGEVGADRLLGRDGDDTLRGDNLPDGWPARDIFNNPAPGQADFSTTGGADFLDGGAGSDLLVGDGGDDILSGGADSDQLFGDDEAGYLVVPGDDVLEGGAGDDLLASGDGADSLSGGIGIDQLFGDKGADVLDGGDDVDTLHGGDGADELFGGSGNDLLYGEGLNNQFALSAAGGADFLDGGTGNDHLEGGMGDDTLFGGTEHDVLFGGEGADSLFGDEGDDELQGGNGNDLLSGDDGNDLLFGQADNDTLYGDEGNDQLAGNDGHDTLVGGVGNDILEGDKGADVLVGGAGHDIYNFSLGDGQDTITDTAFGGEGNVIQFFSSITLQSLTFIQDQAQQTLTIQVAGGDSIRLLGFDPNASNYVVNTLDFADGTVVALADQLPLPGGLIQGTAHDDVIRTGSTDDTIVAGAGHDAVNAGAGNDLILGGSGNDFLAGGVGQDRYVFNTGDGADTIFDSAYEGNQIVFGAGMTSSAITLGRATGDTNTLEVRGQLPGDRLEIEALVPGASPIETFEFADATVLTFDQLIARGIDIAGTSGLETITGTRFIDRIAAGSGNDVLSGLEGADTLLGEDGADVLRGGSGDDILDGGAGNDQLRGEDGVDVLYGGAGDDLLTTGVGPDRLVGGDGHDTYVLFEAGHDIVEVANAGIDTVTIGFSGSFVLPAEVENIELREDTVFASTDFVGNQLDNRMTGPNRLDGREGNDTLIGVGDNIYVYGRGHGQDVIQTGLQTYASSGFVDQIQLLPGVAPTEVTLEGQGNHLVLKIVGTSDQIMVENYLIEPGLRTPTVGEIRFEDGTIWGETDMTNRVGVITGTSGDDTLTGFGNDNEIFGLGGDDQLVGLGGADRLDGGTGNDVLVGGDGNDTYLFGRGDGQDRVNDFPDSGSTGEVDTVFLDSTITPADIRLQATSDSGLLLSIIGTTDQLLVESYFVGSLYQIEQIKFADGTTWDSAAIASRTEGLTLVGTEGPDVLTGIFANDTLSGLGGDDTLIGEAGNDLLMGGADNDALEGRSGNDTLDGGQGTDTLLGGTGNDLYSVDDPGDVVTEQANQGTDTVQSAVTYTLGANVEHLTLTGTTAINGTGNAGNNTLTGNSAANILSGGAGNDTYLVGVGDTVVEQASGGTDTVQSSVSWILASNVESLTLMGSLAIDGTGNTSNNVITGNSGANVLNGGAGADSMTGGASDDTYGVDNAGDTVSENANDGIDTVQSSLTYTLGSNVEHLTLTGATAINGTGNTVNNVLTGNSAVNVLNGGAGADTMAGGGGNDTYVVDNVGDVVTEAAGAGTDTVQSSVTYTLGSDVENLTLTGSSAINGTGNSLNNTLTGNTGNNVLNGGAGVDAMSGGTGNDTYVVDNVSDTVTESTSAGTDTVQSAVTFILGANIENLTLTGTGAINGTGNTLANVLVGNSGVNVLNGGTGADTMSGGAGDDTYVRDNAGDAVTENANEGIDTVQSSLTYTLGANVENLTLTGTTAINGTGNALNNILAGNSAANVLTGGAGNDTYVVGTGDSMVESVNAGTDTVQSSITWTLGANLENLTLTGTGAINGTGNTLDNVLTGNSGTNVLTGGTGNDTYVVGTGDSIVENAGAGTDTVQSSITWTLGTNLENLSLIGASAINGTGNASNNTLGGNSANNVLTGLGGNDTYQYNRGGGQDTVSDNSGASDTMLFGTTINPLDLVISRQANDLRLAIHGSTEQVTVQNWYTSPTTNQVESIQAGNGQTLLNTQVDQLIQAMAGFTAQTGLTWDQGIDQQPQNVQAVLAASWQ